VAPTLRPYRPADRKEVVSLWSGSGLVRPWNDPSSDLDRKVAWDAAHLLVLADGGQLIGSVMIGYEGHRGWINYLAVRPDRRGQGLGRLLMDAAEQRLRALGCPKVNLQVRSSNQPAVEFYRRIGYTVDDVVSMGLRLKDE
jgi:ribosomal protein S18 acetylase RimI-like enzyme